ncbi:transglycosylase SLT domain-containing protein [bacterium]|nr:transglycosylase SLT domain-containing protein [bacterium]
MKKGLIKFLIFVVIICAAGYSVLKYNDKISADNPRLCRQGIEFFNQGDYQNAYYNFSKVNRFSPLHSLAILRQAQCADRLLNYETAEEKYKTFLEMSPKSIFYSSATYNLAKVLFYEKKYDEAKEVFLSLYNSSNKNDYSVGARYFLGLIEKNNDKNLAKKYFLEYIDGMPNGKNSLNSAEELSQFGNELTADEDFAVGKVYFYNKKFDKALSYFYKVPIEKSWAYLAVSNMNLDNKTIAKKQIETGIEKYTSDVDNDILERVYNLYADTFPKRPKQETWRNILNKVSEFKAKGEDFVLFKYAQTLSGESAIVVYNRLSKDYPKSDYAPEAIWQEFWYHYNKKNYSKAKAIGEKFLKDYPKSTAVPRQMYWLGKIALKNNDKQAANGYFSKIMNFYPDNYYAFRTYTLSHNLKNAWRVDDNRQIPSKPYEIDFPISYSNIDIKDLKLINTLLELGDTEVWVEADFGNKIVESWFALKRGQIQRSMVLARDGIEEMPVKPHFDNVVYLLAYPKYFVDDINSSSKEFGLSPFLVMSLIREESYFNPEAKSSSGALGLMQLMPMTADFVAKKYNLPEPSGQNLSEPKSNISYGCGYLRFLDEHFNENDLLSVIAYNAGNGSVKKWVENAKYSDFDEFIENIPYTESRDYIKKVYRSYWNYTNIYR